MKILVTGGLGFIGKYLVEYLLKQKNQVTVFDNFSNLNKIKSISEDKDVKIIEGDITNFNEIKSATKNIDVVVHLAAKISVEESIKNPSETFQVNVEGTKNVLEACKENNIRKIIVASSAAVYGESPPGKKLDENSSKKPISPYGESKMIMEKEVEKFLEKNLYIDCIILRFFNIFGIGQSSEYAGVITKFVERISKSEPLEIFGDGTQTRDFVSVFDAVAAIYNAIQNGKKGIYNIASGKAVTINDLAKLTISLSQKDLKINHLPPKKGDIKFSEADISLAKNEIKYQPKVKLDEIRNLLN